MTGREQVVHMFAGAAVTKTLERLGPAQSKSSISGRDVDMQERYCIKQSTCHAEDGLLQLNIGRPSW
jgi:hypothetical protein